jgi:glycosyltransferase involved in cell wall biosynthesis
MLGLAQALPSRYRNVFLSFAERGLCRPFLHELRRHGLEAVELAHNIPHLLAAAGEVAAHLKRLGADVLCCHGYKADVLGWLAASRAGVPAVAVSRGWTAATTKVRFYEMLDRRVLPWMDKVVCVSQGQATKVRQWAHVPERRLTVIRNAIRTERFSTPDPTGRQAIQSLFAAEDRPRLIVCAAGRLSPEKGFDQLIAAAPGIVQATPSAGFVLFGEGPLRASLQRQIESLRLETRFVLAGFRQDVDRLLPHADLVVLPSFTEGLPNVALEASAAGVPVVATAVGGTPEVILDGATGYLVPPGNPQSLAQRITKLLHDADLRTSMGEQGRRYVREHFTFQAQAFQYQRLFDALVARQHRRPLPVAVLRAIAAPWLGQV